MFTVEYAFNAETGWVKIPGVLFFETVGKVRDGSWGNYRRNWLSGTRTEL